MKWLLSDIAPSASGWLAGRNSVTFKMSGQKDSGPKRISLESFQFIIEADANLFPDGGSTATYLPPSTSGGRSTFFNMVMEINGQRVNTGSIYDRSDSREGFPIQWSTTSFSSSILAGQPLIAEGVIGLDHASTVKISFFDQGGYPLNYKSWSGVFIVE
jgi:hypothetical protein